MNFSEFLSKVPDDVKLALVEVNKRIREAGWSESNKLTELAAYVLGNQGKQIRPLFLFTCAKLFGGKTITHEMIQMASVIELLHTATLVHDDIIDNAKLRRGKPSLNSMAGNNSALLVGDFLLIRAFGICSHLPDFICSITEKLCVDLVQGELEEGEVSLSTTIEDSLKIAEQKTASLFKLCSLSAAYFLGKDDLFLSQAEEFGKLCGIAFQILDDLMDVVGNNDNTGKASGVDLKEKKPSVPILYWIEERSPISKSFLNSHNPSLVTTYLEDLKSGLAIEKSFLMLKEFVEKAKKKLFVLNNHPTTADLLLGLLNQFIWQEEFSAYRNCQT